MHVHVSLHLAIRVENTTAAAYKDVSGGERDLSLTDAMKEKEHMKHSI